MTDWKTVRDRWLAIVKAEGGDFIRDDPGEPDLFIMPEPAFWRLLDDVAFAGSEPQAARNVEMRRLHREGATLEYLAGRYDLSRRRVQNIVHREKWKALRRAADQRRRERQGRP